MSEKILEVENLKVRIGKKAVLNDVSVSFLKGQSVVIAGKNGAGKSTFLKCLANIIFPDKGSIITGKDLSKEKTGFISDRLSLLEDYTVKKAVDFHSEVFHVSDYDDSLLKEMKLSMKQKIKNLSAGERTLFHLSLVLSQKPGILLVDEIIHVIDPYLREKFLEAIIDLMDRYGTTVIMVNHTFSEIEKIPERVLVMEKGQFILDEDTETLGKKLKKVVSKKELAKDVPVIFQRKTSQIAEYFIYPFNEELRDKFSYDYKDIHLNEIIKAFIGGQYVKEGNV